MSRSIWDSPGLDHATFAAAAGYLQLVDEQQYVKDHPNHFFTDPVTHRTCEVDPEWNQNGDGEAPWESLFADASDEADEATETMKERRQASNNTKETPEDRITKRFLDRVAQVFASEKDLDKKRALPLGLKGITGSNQKIHQRPPAAGVTATALLKRPGKGNRQGEIEIFVSKNKGLDDSDKDFGRALFQWLKSLQEHDGRRENKPNFDPSLQQMVDFSRARIRFYVAGILHKRGTWDQNKGRALETLRVKERNLYDTAKSIFGQIDMLFGPAAITETSSTPHGSHVQDM
jgi:hypothetical protein